MGRARGSVHEHGTGDGDDAAPQARRPTGDPHGSESRLSVRSWLRLGGLRTRAIVAPAAVATVAFCWPLIGGALTGVVLRNVGCGVSWLPAGVNLCDWSFVIEFFLLVLALAVLLPIVATWLLRPLRDATDLIAQAGPHNIGLRLPTRGVGPKDELGRLHRALNTALERLGAGYDGQRRFAANAAHELRTPLAVQRALIEISMTGPLTGDQITLLTGQLLQANQRNERLIEGMLVLAEVDQGLTARHPQRFDRIVAQVVESAGAGIRTELGERIVDGEAVLLERLATNLIQNAVKYTPAGGTIQVTTGADPALSVVNSGDEIRLDAIPGLFEPFRRLGGDRIDHSGGAGLGLAIARAIVSAHGGTIRAAPGPSGGLRVDVSLPTADRPR